MAARFPGGDELTCSELGNQLIAGSAAEVAIGDACDRAIRSIAITALIGTVDFTMGRLSMCSARLPQQPPTSARPRPNIRREYSPMYSEDSRVQLRSPHQRKTALGWATSGNSNTAANHNHFEHCRAMLNVKPSRRRPLHQGRPSLRRCRTWCCIKTDVICAITAKSVRGVPRDAASGHDVEKVPDRSHHTAGQQAIDLPPERCLA